MKLQEAFDGWYTWLSVSQAKSTHTVSSYTSDLKQYLQYLEADGIEDTDDITYDEIRDFMQEESEQKASSSSARMAAAIRSFHSYLSFLFNKEDPSINLTVHKNQKVLPVYCTKEEIKALMTSFDDSDPRQLLDHAILELIYSCGLRVSEACSLDINRVDLETGKIRVLGKGNKERIVPIPSGAQGLQKKYLTEVRPLFCRRHSSIYFINEIPDCSSIWNVPAPCNDRACGDFGKQSLLDNQIVSPISCCAFYGNRISQSVYGHDTGIGSQIADKRNIQSVKILSKPVCKLALYIGALR